MSHRVLPCPSPIHSTFFGRYFGDTVDCVAAAVLSGWLSDSTNRTALEAAAGHAVQVLRTSGAVDGSDAPLLSTAATWLIVFGIDGIAVLFGWYTAVSDKRRKGRRFRACEAKLVRWQEAMRKRRERAGSADSGADGMWRGTSNATPESREAQSEAMFPMGARADILEWDRTWDDIGAAVLTGADARPSPDSPGSAHNGPEVAAKHSLNRASYVGVDISSPGVRPNSGGSGNSPRTTSVV